LAVNGNVYIAGTLSYYDSIALAGNGIPSIVYAPTTTNTGSISPTTITNTSVAGVFRVSIYICLEVNNSAPGTVYYTITWTSVGGTMTATSSGSPMTVSGTNYVQATYIVRHTAASSTPIKWSTTIGGGNGNTYRVQVVAEQLV
jgi:hypothetical protein